MTNKFIVTFSLVCISFSVFAQRKAAYISGTYNGKSLLVKTSNGYIEITPFTPNVIRVTYIQKPGDAIKSYSTVAQPGNAF